MLVVDNHGFSTNRRTNFETPEMSKQTFLDMSESLKSLQYRHEHFSTFDLTIFVL